MISITPKNIKIDQLYEWVFFSSSNAVKTFFISNKVNSKIKYAAIGKATASELENHIKPSFIGKGSTEDVAEQFKMELLDGEKVLFPISNLSKQTVQKHLNEKQVFNQVFYETNKTLKHINECDIYVFTSPSNADAFFNSNKTPSSSKVIAIGKATKEELIKHGVRQIFESWDYNSLALWDTI